MVNTNQFIEVWKDSKTVGEAAQRLGLTYGSARTTAWKLRSLGHDVPSRPNYFSDPENASRASKKLKVKSGK